MKEEIPQIGRQVMAEREIERKDAWKREAIRNIFVNKELRQVGKR